MGLQRAVEVDFGFGVAFFADQRSGKLQLQIVGVGVALGVSLHEFDRFGGRALREDLRFQ